MTIIKHSISVTDLIENFSWILFPLLILISACSGSESKDDHSKNNNLKPIVDAGIEQQVMPPFVVQLTSVASDPDGSISSYQWTQTSGESVVIIDADKVNARIELDDRFPSGLLSFSVTVADNQGGTASDSIDVQVLAEGNEAPLVTTDVDQNITRPASVNLISSSSDRDGTIVSYHWQQTSGALVTLTNAYSSIASFDVSDQFALGSLTFLITVTDDDGATGSDAIKVEVIEQSNQAPTISGSYPSIAYSGDMYDYTPQANDEDNDDLTFAIMNKPDWASFDTSSGRLFGQIDSDDIGYFNDITISVSDGQAQTQLPAFSINVLAAQEYNCSYSNLHCVNVTVGDKQEFSSIQEAINVAISGDTVFVFAGDYAGFLFSNSGSPGSPIIVKAIGQVNLTSTSPNSNNVVRFQNVSYITLDGFNISANGSANPYNYDYACVAARGANASSPMRGLTLSNNEISGCSPAGIYLSQTESLLLNNNFVHDNVKDSSNGRGMGIYISNASADNIIVRNNRVVNNANAGFHLNGDSSVGGDGVQTGHLFENNFIAGNGQNGINMDGVQSSSFINNVFANNGGHGMRDFKIDASAGPKDMIVINNTFYSNDSTAIKFTAGAGGHVLFNNLVINNGENVFNIETSTSEEANIFSTDESIFVSPLQQDFRINLSNSAVDGGVNQFSGKNAPMKDINYFDRTASPDVGAYELNSQ